LEALFHFPAVTEIGGGILFRLLSLNSVWILLLAAECEGQLIATHVLGALQQALLGIYTTM
jgi:hypothetical protein